MNSCDICDFEKYSGLCEKPSFKATATRHDIYFALKMIDEVISNIHALRSNIDETFDIWYKQAQTLADTIGSVEETPRRTKTQMFRANVPAESPQGYYKRSVLIPFIDELLQQLNDRFSMDNRHVIQCLFSIILSLIVDKANIQGIAENLPSPKSILSELQQWKLYWQCKKDAACDLRTSLLHCDGDAFPNIRQLLLRNALFQSQVLRRSGHFLSSGGLKHI